MKRSLMASLLAIAVSQTFAQEVSKISPEQEVQTPLAQNGSSQTFSNMAVTTNNHGEHAGSTTNTSTVNYPSKTHSTITTTPSMGAPYLTAAGSDVCLGSVSGAISVMGFGASGGGTKVDENCVLLKNSARLAQMGMPDAAIALFASNPDNLEAIKLGAPNVYYSILSSRYKALRSQVDALRQLGKPTGTQEAQLEDLDLQLTIAQHLIKEK